MLDLLGICVDVKARNRVSGIESWHHHNHHHPPPTTQQCPNPCPHPCPQPRQPQRWVGQWWGWWPLYFILVFPPWCWVYLLSGMYFSCSCWYSSLSYLSCFASMSTRPSVVYPSCAATESGWNSISDGSSIQTVSGCCRCCMYHIHTTLLVGSGL